ncbi:MAG: hypothetical protein ABI895_20475 [Deltaproteobacteria bacterium]
MRKLFAAVVVLLLALGLSACSGCGRSVDPPRHPDGEFETRERPEPSAAEGSDGRFAQPPAGAEDERSALGNAPYDSRPEADAERRSAPEPAPAPPGTGRSEKSASGAPQAEASGDAAARGRGAPLEEARQKGRPGLATHWGETRYSPTHEVSFEREDSSSPTASAELRYNDRSGARRLLPRGHSSQGELTLLGGALRVRMLDANGRTFPALSDGSRVVSMGQPGERYSLSIENRTGQRYEVVATVDGLDVLDGQDGSPEKRGYLISAYSSVMIDGFRRTEQEVAAFRLGDVAHSYAASQGNARNVGVIGVAAFAERQAVVYYPRPPLQPWNEDTRLRDSADPFPGRYARPPAW